MTQPPVLHTSLPGPRSRALVDDLARYECPAITARRARRAGETGVDQDPIIWERAKDGNVWDVDGNRFVDLCSAFAVTGVGHANDAVVAAGREQLGRLPHAMGDVYPSAERVALCRKLAEVTPGDLQQSFLCQSGASAIEAALKTAVMATGKPGIVAFENAYHGLGYGALAATHYRDSFRRPFLEQLNPHVTHLPFPSGGAVTRVLASVEVELRGGRVGAVIFEPIQGRGGFVEAPQTFVHGLRDLCTQYGVVLIADEIFTGFGRTGTWFACEHYGVIPDVMCVGKAMGGGFPISAAIGRPEIMQGWGDSRGEAIHTSTFLGNPIGCAMALAAIDELESGLVDRAASEGAWLAAELGQRGAVRGRGLMLGLEVGSMRGLTLMRALLERGYLVLPCGPEADVLGLTPPFVLPRQRLSEALAALDEVL
jgi:4-aminobutyrate aminotransferase / (S)-3-amino-2-methylpropionate transaminase / 5-aminovalerate transaminase